MPLKSSKSARELSTSISVFLAAGEGRGCTLRSVPPWVPHSTLPPRRGPVPGSRDLAARDTPVHRHRGPRPGVPDFPCQGHGPRLLHQSGVSADMNVILHGLGSGISSIFIEFERSMEGGGLLQPFQLDSRFDRRG